MKLKIFSCIVFHIFALFSSAQTPVRAFKVEKRIILSEGLNETDIKAFRIIDANNKLIIANFENFKTEGIISISQFSYSGLFIKSFILSVNKSDLKLLKQVRVETISFLNDSIYILFSNMLLIWDVGKTGQMGRANRILLNHKYTYMTAKASKLYLINASRSYDKVRRDKLVYISVFDFLTKKDSVIFGYTPEKRYLLNYNSPKPFDLNPEGNRIVHLSLDTPILELLDLSGHRISSYIFNDEWISPNAEEIEQLNRYSDDDPHKAFSLIGDRLLTELSSNIRVDAIGKNLFTTTYMPGAVSNAKVSTQANLYEISGDSIKFKATFDARPMNYAKDDTGMEIFCFPNVRNTFVHMDSKRYQICIEPQVDMNITDQQKIEEAKKRSILENKFDLCLYIGTLNLP